MSSEIPAAAPLGARRGFRLLFAYLAAQLAGGIVTAICVAAWYAATVGLRTPGAVPEAMTMATVLGGVIGIIVGGRVVRWRLVRGLDAASRGAVLAECGWVASSIRANALAALAGLALGGLYLAAESVIPQSRDSAPGLLGQAALSGGWALFLWAFLAVAVAPPVEEFVFRGVLWTAFRRSWPPLGAGALVTAVFVAMHLAEAWGNAVALGAIATLGVVTLAVRVRSGSFVPAIFLHAAYNGLIAFTVLGARP